MREIVDYVTAVGSLIQGVDVRVKELIVEGYQPFGDPYVLEADGNVCQAMVKYEAESDSASG